MLRLWGCIRTTGRWTRLSLRREKLPLTIGYRQRDHRHPLFGPAFRGWRQQ